MHQTIFKAVGVRENSVRLRRVPHIFLNAKIMDAQLVHAGGITHLKKIASLAEM
jgi:L-alanine-DL-glutamate epimerase-like enolase superfamily enzyme